VGRYAHAMITALAGGVGAARFLRGLVQVVDPAEVTVVVTTADDDWFHGLYVCPDLDSVTYTLAGAQNPDTGWGLAGETFATVDALARYGEDTWFRLGDRDLATHLFRTRRLREGATLSEVTAEVTPASGPGPPLSEVRARLTRPWGLGPRLLPMTDGRIATRITVAAGELAMQEWFVRERCEPPVLAVRFEGADAAVAAPGVIDAILAADTVLVCPSNPVISIAPILAVDGVRDALVSRRDRVVGVSPIIAGRPVKGPADRLMGPLGIDVSCVGV